MKKLSSRLLILSLLLWQQGAGSQTKNAEIVMNLEIGTLSEIMLPEPYTTIQIPVQIVEMRDVPGRNKQVITLHPIVAQKTKTNIRIYTQNYDFNIRFFINWPKRPATESLDLSTFVKPLPPKKLAASKETQKSGAPTNGKSKSNNVHNDDLVTQADFDVRNLLDFYPQLLKSDKRAPAIVKNRVVFAIDHIFAYKGKLVFKATLWNKSKVPYNILHLTITYKERTGLPLINQRESKSLMLAPFYEVYSRKVIPPGKKSHIIYVTSKLSPQDTGFFNCLLIEKNGTRNFDFNIPSYIK
ncbi:MAG: DUF4138 domain-containing protein [bacterium]